jgi:hypothetical protein
MEPVASIYSCSTTGPATCCRQWPSHRTLAFAPKELQWKLFIVFNQVAEELQEFKNNMVAMLAPLPRYLASSCCEKADHIPNRQVSRRRWRTTF